MNAKVRIGLGGPIVNLTQKNYLASGGEAAVYQNGGMVYKIYHDPTKTLPAKKIQELGLIKNSNVIVPKEVIFEGSKPVGYTTSFVSKAEPIIMLFTKTFKIDNHISPQMVAELVKKMQLVTRDIHDAKCLVVDYNELNILVQIVGLNPFYIDTDSYSTPSFRATAIMDSVRDRRVSTHTKGQLVYSPDILSDWYSWGILAFSLYTNIHPFQGNHPKYKASEKGQQFDDGISVFHKDVRVPPCVNNFNVIPKRHLDWFKDTFFDKHRSIPPLADSSIPMAMPAAMVMIKGNAAIDVTQVAAYSGQVEDIYRFMGVDFVVTKTEVTSRGRKMGEVERHTRVTLTQASDGTVVLGKLLANQVTFSDLMKGINIGTVEAHAVFVRNGAIYTVGHGKLIENTFMTFGGKTVHKITELENVSQNSKAYIGCVIQDLLGKKYLTLPYALGKSFSKYLPQLDKHRVLSAKSEKWVTIIMTECGGKYYRFVVVFSNDFLSFEMREVADITYDTINFTVTESGLCLLLASSNQLELFFNNKKVEVLTDPPFDATMKLFNNDTGVFFISGNTVHQIHKK